MQSYEQESIDKYKGECGFVLSSRNVLSFNGVCHGDSKYYIPLNNDLAAFCFVIYNM